MQKSLPSKSLVKYHIHFLVLIIRFVFFFKSHNEERKKASEYFQIEYVYLRAISMARRKKKRVSNGYEFAAFVFKSQSSKV